MPCWCPSFQTKVMAYFPAGCTSVGRIASRNIGNAPGWAAGETPGLRPDFPRSPLHKAQGQASRRNWRVKWLRWPSIRVMSPPVPPLLSTWTDFGSATPPIKAVSHARGAELRGVKVVVAAAKAGVRQQKVALDPRLHVFLPRGEPRRAGLRPRAFHFGLRLVLPVVMRLAHTFGRARLGQSCARGGRFRFFLVLRNFRTHCFYNGPMTLAAQGSRSEH